MQHVCAYSVRLEWGPWQSEGDLRVREARRVPRCRVCGREQPERHPRTALRREVETIAPRAPALPDETARRVAARLATTATAAGEDPVGIGFQGLCSTVRLPASAVEESLSGLLRAGWVRLSYRIDGTRRTLQAVSVLDRDAVESLARPGLRERRDVAIQHGRTSLRGLAHPVAARVMELLDSREVERISPEVIDALAEVARHAASGEILARRVFSTRYLGDSKALERVAATVERLLEPLETLGLRDGAAVTLIGGSGTLRLEGGALELAVLRPFVGLPRGIESRLVAVDAPASGILVVENLAAFEACCRGEVPGTGDPLIVWSAGWPGRTVRALVNQACSSGAPVRAWADLDLAGIRIARLIHEWTGGRARPWRMEGNELRDVTIRRPLTLASAAAIRRDLETRPEALLAETLRAILDAGAWVEQEAMLAARSS